MKKLLVYLKAYKKECVLAPLFKLLEAGFELVVPLVVASLIDKGIGGNDSGYVVRMALILVGFAFVGYGFSITAQYFAAKAAVGCATELRSGLFSHIMKLSFKNGDDCGTATLITRMTSDVNQVQSGVNMTLRLFLRSPFIVFGALIMAFTVDTKAALIFAIIIPVLFAVVFLLMKFTVPKQKKAQGQLDRVLGRTGENLNGVRVIRAFGLEDTENEAFEKETGLLRVLQLAAGRISSVMNPLTYVLINGALIVLLYVGAIRVESGALTGGDVVALVNYISQILVELIKLANLCVTIAKAIACGDRIEAVMEITEGMEQCGENAGQNKGTCGKEDRDNIPAVEFRHVFMRYGNGGEDALEDISFSAMPGETIGIIGGTGAGKTSIVNLIPRFYDVTEKCTEAGNGVFVKGKNVREYDPAVLRGIVGTVMQKAVLFKGTIRENLRWGNENATDEEINKALKLAQAYETVAGREKGLDSEVEQEGRNFSGGQKQRLSIARTLLQKPEILILDDSSSALDYATDRELRRALGGLEWKPTVFIVSQRTSSIMNADRILVLEDGVLVGNGTHEKLLKECDVYREIHEISTGSNEQ